MLATVALDVIIIHDIRYGKGAGMTKGVQIKAWQYAWVGAIKANCWVCYTITTYIKYISEQIYIVSFHSTVSSI